MSTDRAWLSTREVAAETGWSIPTIGRHLRGMHAVGSELVRRGPTGFTVEPTRGVDAVVARCERRAWLSTRQLAVVLGVSHTTGWEILREAEASGHNLVWRVGRRLRVHRAAVGDMRWIMFDRRTRHPSDWMSAEERAASARRASVARWAGRRVS